MSTITSETVETTFEACGHTEVIMAGTKCDDTCETCRIRWAVANESRLFGLFGIRGQHTRDDECLAHMWAHSMTRGHRPHVKARGFNHQDNHN